MQILGSPSPGVSESGGLEWGLRICLSNRLSGDTNAASRGGIIIGLTGPLLMDSCVVLVLG